MDHFSVKAKDENRARPERVALSENELPMEVPPFPVEVIRLGLCKSGAADGSCSRPTLSQK